MWLNLCVTLMSCAVSHRRHHSYHPGNVVSSIHKFARCAILDCYSVFDKISENWCGRSYCYSNIVSILCRRTHHWSRPEIALSPTYDYFHLHRQPHHFPKMIEVANVSPYRHLSLSSPALSFSQHVVDPERDPQNIPVHHPTNTLMSPLPVYP